MGIKYFWKNTPPGRRFDFSEFKDKTVGIDANIWMVRVSKSVKTVNELEKLAANFNYFAKRLRFLLKVCAKVVLVFDGLCLPLKLETQLKRRSLAPGAGELAKSIEELNFEKERMAQQTFNLFSVLSVEFAEKQLLFIMAPYEADPQLVYLEKTGIIDYIISDDSDHFALGCQKLIRNFNFSKVDGRPSATLLTTDDVLNNNCSIFYKNSREGMTNVCIFLGCDYLKNPLGIGPKKICKAFKYKLHPCVKRLRQHFKQVSEEYEENFNTAWVCFKFQKVYCPNAKRCLPLNTPTSEYKDAMARAIEKEGSFDFLGRHIPDGLAGQIARFIINPFTMKPYNDPIDYMLVKRTGQRLIKRFLTTTGVEPHKTIRRTIRPSNLRNSKSDIYRNRSLLIQEHNESPEDSLVCNSGDSLITLNNQQAALQQGMHQHRGEQAESEQSIVEVFESDSQNNWNALPKGVPKNIDHTDDSDLEAEKKRQISKNIYDRLTSTHQVKPPPKIRRNKKEKQQKSGQGPKNQPSITNFAQKRRSRLLKPVIQEPVFDDRSWESGVEIIETTPNASPTPFAGTIPISSLQLPFSNQRSRLNFIGRFSLSQMR